MIIRTLRRGDAHAAAMIHMEGQPDTFLTSLGERFLVTLYTEISDSHWAFGFVAVAEEEIVGIGIATTDTRQLFRDTLLRRGWRLIPILAIRALRSPSLLTKIWKTRSYPARMGIGQGEGELLFVGVRPAYRRRGIGRQLVRMRLAECRRRGCSGVLAMVEKSNEANLQMLSREGFEPQKELTLYGREVLVLRYDLLASRSPGSQRSEEGFEGRARLE